MLQIGENLMSVTGKLPSDNGRTEFISTFVLFQSIVQRPRVSESRMSLDPESVLDVTEDTTDINTAIFYSITSTQKGNA